MNENKSPIPSRLYNAAKGGHVAGTADIIDDDKGKTQDVINKEIDSALENRYTKNETYNKTELNNLITTPNQKYVSVTATSQTTAATDVLPATGAADTVYRVGNWDGTQYDESLYTEYAWNGSAYVSLSVKSQIGEVYDISLNHAGTTYADLNAALGTNGANIPQSLRKGGMSVKFIQTSENKYAQYRLIAEDFTTDVTKWVIYIDTFDNTNPEWLFVITSLTGQILGGFKADGDFEFTKGIPTSIKEYITENLEKKVDKVTGKGLILTDFADMVSMADDREYIYVILDNNKKIIAGIKKDGEIDLVNSVPSSIKEYVELTLKNTVENLPYLKYDELSIIKQAAEYDAVNLYRERYLREEYNKKVREESYVGKWYGVQWSEESDPDNVIAINSDGDSNLHITLPIQNKMKRCVTKNNIVQYYLNENNSELKEDGTQAKLDGTDGNVMVEIPEFFYKVEVADGINRTIRIKISEDALPDFIFSPRRYTSAYEATINRELNLLSSVCTTNYTRAASEEVKTEQNNYIQGNATSRGNQKTARRNGHTANAASYRGGTNDAYFDSFEDSSEQNYSRNQLGLPVANISREEIRNVCADNQFGYLYDTQRILYILIQVEYKTRELQKAISSGGLGMGATVYPDYNSYEAFFKPQGGISVIPCGVTNSLGNKSGEVYYLLENVPVASEGSGQSISYTRFANVWMPCMSYRGVEHFYGHIYKIADQLECMTGPVTGYVSGHEGDHRYSYHDVSWWYEKNPYLSKLQIVSDKNKLGTWNFLCSITVVSSILAENGHIVHINASANQDFGANYCYCCEVASTNYNIVKYVTFNGRIVSGNLCGLNFIVSFNSVKGGDKRTSDGTRLDHF